MFDNFPLSASIRYLRCDTITRNVRLINPKIGSSYTSSVLFIFYGGHSTLCPYKSDTRKLVEIRLSDMFIEKMRDKNLRKKQKDGIF